MKALKVRTISSRKQDLIGDGEEGFALMKLSKYNVDLAAPSIQKLYETHNLKEVYGYLVLFSQYEYPLFRMNFSFEELDYEDIEVSEEVQMYLKQFEINGENLWTYV